MSMKSEEKLYFVTTDTVNFKKGDEIRKLATPFFESLEEDDSFKLFNADFTPAKKRLLNDPKVSLVEVSYDINEKTEDELENYIVFTVIEDNTRYENAIEFVSDFEQASAVGA